MGARGVALKRALLERVRDEPLTVETRALLLAPESEIFGDARAPGRVVLRHRPARLVAALGRAGEDELGRATADLEGSWELIGPIDELARLARLLPDWRPEPAEIFTLTPEGPKAGRAVEARVRSVEREVPGLLDLLEGEFHREIADCVGRTPLAAAFVDGVAVSFCYVYLETETWWDVAIGTLAGYRRRGLAAACARELIERQTRRGKRPVWGALEGNEASRKLAMALGFEAAGRLAVLEKPGAVES